MSLKTSMIVKHWSIRNLSNDKIFLIYAINLPVQVIRHRIWQKCNRKFRVLALLSSYCNPITKDSCLEKFLYIKITYVHEAFKGTY